MKKLLSKKRVWLPLALVVLSIPLLFVWLANVKPAQVQQGSSGDAIFVKIAKTGISSGASEVIISNYRPGGRAEITYRVHNATAVAVMPEIFYNTDADIADYSKADGAVKAPAVAASWLEIPKLSDIPPGQITDFVVALVMPKNVKKPADKFGFQVGVAGNTGGKLQTAVGTWWIITMR